MIRITIVSDSFVEMKEFISPDMDFFLFLLFLVSQKKKHEEQDGWTTYSVVVMMK
jgi:hypothetical protein